MVHSMLKSKHMPKEFWAEAMACAVYLSNRSPIRSLQKATPQEKWSGWKPTLSHIRVFGIIAYVHVPDEKKSSWMKKVRSMCLLAMMQSPKATSFTIQRARRLL